MKQGFPHRHQLLLILALGLAGAVVLWGCPGDDGDTSGDDDSGDDDTYDC